MLETTLISFKNFLIFTCLLALITSCADDKKDIQSKNAENNHIKTPLQKTSPIKTKNKTDSKKQIPIVFDDASLAAFETCTITESFLKTREKMILNSKPSHITEGYLTYKLATKFAGFPVKEIIFGICSNDKPLQKDCSFVEEVAFILDADFEKVKSQLQSEKGIDFTLVKRASINGEDEGATLRPVLYKGKDGSTVLHCDTGGL